MPFHGLILNHPVQCQSFPPMVPIRDMTAEEGRVSVCGARKNLGYDIVANLFLDSSQFGKNC